MLGLLRQTSPGPINLVAEDEIVLRLLWPISPGLVNMVVINHSNTCMLVEFCVGRRSDNCFYVFDRPGQVRSFNIISVTLFPSVGQVNYG